MGGRYIEFVHCEFCEKLADKLRAEDKEMCGPYESAEYYISSRMDEIIERLFEKQDEPNLKPKGTK